MKDNINLFCTKFNRKYLDVFVSRYGQKNLIERTKQKTRKYCENIADKKVKVIKTEACPDILLVIEDERQWIRRQVFKENDSAIFKRHTNLKHKHEKISFLYRRYYKRTAEKKSNKTIEYIQKQLKKGKSLN